MTYEKAEIIATLKAVGSFRHVLKKITSVIANQKYWI